MPKPECDGELYTAMLVGTDKIYCNCVEHGDPAHNTPVNGTHHQHGFARVPDVLREKEYDHRQITILSEELTVEDLKIKVAQNKKLDLFGKSPCTGSTSIGADELSFVEFADLFNHDECKPICEESERDGTRIETCRAIVGYDDLYHTLPSGINIRKEVSDWWEFTCTRQMTDNVDDTGGVDSVEFVTDNPIDLTGERYNNFTMELQCCDPADPDCTKCFTETERTHIIRIEPNADTNESFLMDLSMKDQQRDEYLHIEQCIYTERDDNGNQLGNSITLIEDGCDVSGGLIEFKGTFCCLKIIL